nr:Cof-type HAD-IIB family hydrolase [Corynebacterium lactis]
MTENTAPSAPSDTYRLVVTDMDGTLLGEDKQIPESFWPVVTQLLERGVHFAPASGRQYATLADQFSPIADRIPIIAENGNYVVYSGEVVSVTSIDHDVVARLVRAIRDFNDARAAADRTPLSVIVCGATSAYVEFFPARFGIPEAEQQRQFDEASKYYLKLAKVDDVIAAAAADDIVKLAIFDPYDVEEESAPHLRAQSDKLKGVISGKHWLDLIDADTNKGTALRDLQAALGVAKEETVCFVDYLNDLELIDYSGRSFAMDNGHPEIKRRATDIAPPNTAEGVVVTLKRLFGLD